jgi:hypothetical protein
LYLDSHPYYFHYDQKHSQNLYKKFIFYFSYFFWNYLLLIKILIKFQVFSLNFIFQNFKYFICYFELCFIIFNMFIINHCYNYDFINEISLNFKVIIFSSYCYFNNNLIRLLYFINLKNLWKMIIKFINLTNQNY